MFPTGVSRAHSDDMRLCARARSGVRAVPQAATAGIRAWTASGCREWQKGVLYWTPYSYGSTCQLAQLVLWQRRVRSSTRDAGDSGHGAKEPST